MIRNGLLKAILKRMDEPNYTLRLAREDVAYLIDYARGLEEDNYDLTTDLAWTKESSSGW